MIFRTVLGRRLGLHGAARRDAGIPIPGKDWPDEAQTPIERGIGSIVELGGAECNERYARRLRWTLPRLYGRERRIINLTVRIDDIDDERSYVYAKLEEAERHGLLDHVPRLSALVVWIAVAALAVADFPLNITSFAVVPLSTKALDVMVAALGVVLAIAPVVLAKAVIAAIEAKEKEARAAFLVVTVGLVAAVVVGVQGLSFMRTRFVETSPALRSLGVRLGGVGAALTKVQVCLIAVAFAAAILANDPAAARRRRQRAKLVWLSVRLWLLGRRRDVVAVSVVVLRTIVALVTMRHEARLGRLRASCSDLIQSYRARLLRGPPDAVDAKVGNRAAPDLPAIALEPVPEPWDLPSKTRSSEPGIAAPTTLAGVRSPTNGQRVGEEV